MFLGVLGSLVARDDDGRSLRLSGPSRRLLLAAMLARVGQTVPSTILFEDLWGDAPPTTAAKTLHTHILRLRHDLAGSGLAASQIVTEPSGYRLSLPSAAVDVGCFERDLEAGRAALGQLDAKSALVHLDSALSWWRGPAYAEFRDAEFAIFERLRLSELHAFAHEQRIDAAIRLGWGASLVADIEARIALEPYRERSWEQLMIALYRAGRQSDALSAYHRARQRMVDELGVEPGPGLRLLERRILDQDESLFDLVTPETRSEAVPSEMSLVCPYQGLARYDEQDAGLFVARERLVAKLAGRLGEADLLVLTGASGTGKSSLVRAGLVPALRSGALPGSAAWRCAVVTPDDLGVTSHQAVDVLVVDQAEEMFTVLDAEANAIVQRRLVSALAAGVRVVVVLRADFYGRLAEIAGLAGRVAPATVLIGSLTEEELARVVSEPARRVGLQVEPELVDEVLADVRGQPGALPLLSAALVRTWQNRRGRMLTLEGYLAGGGVEGALEAASEEAYLGLDDSSQVAARRLLLRLATRDAGVWSHRPILRGDIGQLGLLADESTLDQFSTQRLVTVSETRIELVHEALLTQWPRLRAWLEERSTVADMVEHLGAASRAWEAGGRPETDLYRGARLQAVLDWRDTNPDDVVKIESEFIDSSATAAEAELMNARRRVAAEVGGRRRLRRVAIGLAAVTALALAGIGVAVGERTSALQERSSADRAALAADQAALAADASKVSALALSAPDLRTSLLLAVAGYRLQNSTDARSALLTTLENHGSALWRMPTDTAPRFLCVSADGKQLWVLDAFRVVHRYDADTRTQINSFPAYADTAAAVSPDGQQLVLAGPTYLLDDAGAGRVSVDDAATGNRIRTLPVTAAPSSNGATWATAVFTRDGRWLAVVEAAPKQPADPLLGAPPLQPGRTVAIFDTRNYAAAPRLLRLDAPVTELAAGTDTIAAATASGQLVVVRAADESVVSSAHLADLAQSDPTHPVAYPFALSPDGSRLALSRPTNPQLPLILATAHLTAPPQVTETLTGTIDSIVFSPSDRLLAVSAQSGEVDVFHTADGSQALEPYQNQPGPFQYLAWSGTNSDTGLYLSGPGPQVVSLDLNDRPRLVALHDRPIPDVGEAQQYGSNILFLAQSSADASHARADLVVADLGTGVSRSLPFHLPTTGTLAWFSADAAGDRALVEYADPRQVMHTVVIDVTTGRVLGTFEPTSAPSTSLSFLGVMSPSGSTAAFTIGSHRIGVFSMPDGTLIRAFDLNFTGPGASHLGVTPWASAPDGRLLVGGFNGGFPHRDQLAAIIDLRTGHLDGEVNLGKFGFLGASAWSPDGKRLVLGTYGGQVMLVDASTLAPLSGLTQASAQLVQTISFSPDGRTILVGGGDGTLTFWDGSTMQPIGRPIASPVLDSWWAWYKPDGDIAGYAPSTKTGDNQWFTMPGSPADWASAACRIAGSQLTHAEWDRYVGSQQPYQNVC